MATEQLDVLIVGAGLSGVGAACHLRRHCPDKRIAIVEAREALGGTWDLFRYPGIRSDSDMYTLGYSFKPWSEGQVIADGASIRRYIEEAATEHGVDRLIRYRHRLLGADWCTASARWQVRLQSGDSEPVSLSCRFLMMCTGYYRYDAGYTPDFPGREDFSGTIIHPQHWPEDFDPAGKHIVVIGSGATAVTLVPALAEQAASVTMLQRSPSYVMNLPQRDALSIALRRILPLRWVYRLARGRNIALQMFFHKMARTFPTLVRRLLQGLAQRQLGPGYDMRHFTPHYKPWDERLCAVPDGDLFRVLRQGRASVVTARIGRFVAQGIELEDGKRLAADVIVTATGLQLQLFGGARLSVDGVPFDVPTSMGYRGIMLRDLPNLAVVTGYTNASWTLKADLSSEYFCRLIRHMDATGMHQVVPRDTCGDVKPAPFLDLNSGYIRRAAHLLPAQGHRAPWRLHQNYALDLAMLRYGELEDGYLVFSSAPEAQECGAAPVCDVG